MYVSKSQRICISSLLLLFATASSPADDTIHVFMGTDHKYIKPTSVAIASMTRNFRSPGSLAIHMFDFGMISGDIDILRASSHKPRTTFEVIPTAQFNLDQFTIGSKWPKGVFCKYWIPDLASERGIDRAWWLDGDIVVAGDLGIISKIRFGQNKIAAVMDWGPSNQDYVNVTKGKAGTFSINAGVILFNVKKMKEDQALSKLTALTHQRKGEYKYVEQEILTEYAHPNIKWLGRENNFQILGTVALCYGYQLTQLDGIEAPPVIISEEILIYHYNLIPKPWALGGFAGPYADIWYHYLRQTPFWDFSNSCKESIAMETSKVFRLGSFIRQLIQKVV